MKLKYILITLYALSLLSILRSEQLIRTFNIDSDELFLQMDIDFAKVRVLPNESKNDFYVRIKYNQRDCDAEIVYDESKNKIRLLVDQHSFFKTDNDYDNKKTVVIDIELPYRPKYTIKTKIKAGSIDFRLGGLQIKEFALKNWAGEIDIDFDQPNQIVMKTMDVNCKLGEVNISNLGNAHCESVDINSGIGELTVDFCGEYCKETSAEIDLDIGETTLILPKETAIKMRVSDFSLFSNINYPYKFRKEGKYLFSKSYQQQEKSLDLRISTGIGELNFRMN